MATVQRENIGYLNDKISVRLTKEDYMPEFEKSLKQFAKTANVPGFRKGMVPTGMIKKMYGTSLLADQLFKTSEKELMRYIKEEQVDVFLQPIPAETQEKIDIDINNQTKEYQFDFEVAVKPNLDIDFSTFEVIDYKIQLAEDMLKESIENLQNRFGSFIQAEKVEDEKHVINFKVKFEDKAEAEEDVFGVRVENLHTNLQQQLIGKAITDNFSVTANEFISVDSIKASFEKKYNVQLDNNSSTIQLEIQGIEVFVAHEVNKDLFEASFPNEQVETEEDFKNRIKADLEKTFAQYSKNQVHDQIFHKLFDYNELQLPESFIEKWKKVASSENTDLQKAETADLVKQFRWELIINNLAEKNQVQVLREDLRNHAKNMLFNHFGGAGDLEQQEWLTAYLDKMIADKKFIEENFYKIRQEKVFDILGTKVKAVQKEISFEDFKAMVEAHNHEHH